MSHFGLSPHDESVPPGWQTRVSVSDHGQQLSPMHKALRPTPARSTPRTPRLRRTASRLRATSEVAEEVHQLEAAEADAAAAAEAGAGDADAEADPRLAAGGRTPSRRVLASAAAGAGLVALVLRRSGGSKP